MARTLLEFDPGIELWGIDNFLRTGSEQNRAPLRASGVHLLHGDVRCRSDLDVLPEVHWVIDAAANPSVLAGMNGDSTHQLIEHNLIGAINLLELVKGTRAGLILLSTSRVYSIAPLVNLPVTIENEAYRPQLDSYRVVGLSSEGVAENFPTAPPVSLYGATKLASEIIALEYGEAFGLPIWINRCGVLAGAGQFGTAEQGIFAFWVNSYLRRRPLKYIGFDGQGYQVRDCLHPRDVATVVWRQIQAPDRNIERIQNVSGGVESAMSLAQLSGWCAWRFGQNNVEHDVTSRPYDVPWLVLDAARAKRNWDWRPALSVEQILEDIAAHAEAHPEWLKISGYA